MRRMPVVVALIALGATAAWALQVIVPDRVRARATVIVNDMGEALFGTTPGKVEVVNLPGAPSESIVTLADAVPMTPSTPPFDSPVFPTGTFRNVVLFGATVPPGNVFVTCYYAVEPWASIDDATPKAKVDWGYISYDMSYVLAQDRPPMLGSYFGCRVYAACSGCNSLVTLKARFTS